MTSQDTDRPAVDLAILREELIRRRLRGTGLASDSVIGHADRNAPLPLSPGQRQMWFLSRLDPDNPEYLVPIVLRLRGPADVTALRQAFRHLVMRHEILRTRYALADGQPVQVIEQPGPADLAVRDLSDVDPAERERLLTEQIERETLTPLDLSLDLPVRGTVLKLADDDHTLVLIVHHIACDEASVGILVTEMGELYSAFRAGRYPRSSLRTELGRACSASASNGRHHPPAASGAMAALCAQLHCRPYLLGR